MLIGGRPAARQGDPHVCPLWNGSSPHGGGPVAKGAATVLINGQPAARVGDVAVCAGPPDAIATGASQVLIREGGAPVRVGGGPLVRIGEGGPVVMGGGFPSGSGGRGGAETGRQGAVAAAAEGRAASPDAATLQEHWLDIRFEDAAGRRVSGVPYALEAPSGAVTEGWLTGNGRVRREGLSEGTGTVTLRCLQDAKWSTSEATVGQEVRVTATATGFADGTDATVEVRRVPAEGGHPSTVQEIETAVEGEAVQESWTYAYQETGRPAASGPQMPAYVAEVRVDGHPRSAMTGVLTYEDRLRLQLVRSGTDEPLEDHPYRLALPNGEVRSGTTDANGWIEEDRVPPGDCELI